MKRPLGMMQHCISRTEQHPFTAELAMPKGTWVAEADVNGLDVTLKGLSEGNAAFTITDSNNDRGVVSMKVNNPVGS